MLKQKDLHAFQSTQALPGQIRTASPNPIRCGYCRVPMIDGVLDHKEGCRLHPAAYSVSAEELRERERKEAASVLEAAARQNVQPTIRLKAIGCSHEPFDFPIDTAPPKFARHISAPCPGCRSVSPDCFPALCTIIRSEERSLRHE